ncbi:hypothetical protein HYH03_016689 [Edaphochlamys debaryana]|uniref:Uncharacterized protein n=1 Tax=Edaphochlamys debaryana TaxID=47281 RepID=A0A836BR89_9CHLO|nr:hypothetical protein HYH03_016689 [Edaphochlamys debaryana]|eukprot:KAG2484554.1 hypothetical protein HYH03_016689 [Edaphochlamys debaryana]
MACPLPARAAAGHVCATTSVSSPVRASPAPCVSGHQRRGGCAARAYGEAPSTTTSTSTSAESPRGLLGSIRIKVNPPRPTSAPPAPPSLIHSPAFVQRELIKPGEVAPGPSAPPAVTERPRVSRDESDGERPGSRLAEVIKRVDRSLDELEQKPLPLQREIYQASRSPVGKATGIALEAAAKVTVAATKEAVKVAVPMGQWVLKEGAKAAMALMQRAMQEAARKEVEGGTGTRRISVKKKRED